MNSSERILAIETSCDETAAAIVADGRHILSNRVASQIELHRRFGGVYPEVASRQHVLAIQTVVEDALRMPPSPTCANWTPSPSPTGQGWPAAFWSESIWPKGWPSPVALPLVPVNHLEGHVYSNWLCAGEDAVASDIFPTLILIVSGGHTELVLMEGHCLYRLLGATLDDAAGEAFDKVARLLQLGYPGGPAVQTAAEAGDALRFHLPRPLSRPARRTEVNPGALASRLLTVLPVRGEHRFNFSFSGLKTAVLNLMRQLERDGAEPRRTQTVADIAAAFQMAVVDVLVSKTAGAATEFAVKQVCICGGVSANRLLRQTAEQHFAKMGLPLRCPPLFLCTDNAAMIGAAAYYRRAYNQAVARSTHREQSAEPPTRDALALDVYANLPLTEAL